MSDETKVSDEFTPPPMGHAEHLRNYARYNPKFLWCDDLRAAADELDRLTSQNAKMASALAHYEGWFGTECPCDDDECALDGWAK